jgi:hypothetical protein
MIAGRDSINVISVFYDVDGEGTRNLQAKAGGYIKARPVSGVASMKRAAKKRANTRARLSKRK